jgi:hypothetical protein
MCRVRCIAVDGEVSLLMCSFASEQRKTWLALMESLLVFVACELSSESWYKSSVETDVEWTK